MVKDNNGVYGSYSTSNLFSINLGAVSLLSPTNNALVNISGPTLNWSMNSIASNYLVEISLDTNFSSILLSNIITSTNYVLPIILSNESTNYWRVRVQDGNGMWSQWSSVNSMKIDLMIPVINMTNPSNNEFINGNVVICGTATDNRAIKSVYIKIDNGSYMTSTLSQSGGTNITWSSNFLSAMISDGTHTLYVYAMDEAGNCSATNQISLSIDNSAVYVSKSGNDNTKGSKSAPKLTIQNAIEYALTNGITNVFVAQGTYFENIIMRNKVSIIGAYNNNFTSRDFTNTRSIIDGKSNGSNVIYCSNISDISTKIDGFVITNGWTGNFIGPEFG